MLRTKYSEEIEKQMKAFYDTLNEKDRRRYAAIEAIKFGHGGQNYISSVLGCHFQTVMAGINEITNGIEKPNNRIRKLGGGKKKIIDTVENIDDVFFEILKDHRAGSPMDKEIKWTNLSFKEISKAFKLKDMNISPHVVKQLLKKHGFVKRKMQKSVSMKDSKDRNEQFEKIKKLREEYSKSENPVISIDVKKEVIGNFYRDGKAYCTQTVKVYDHDFSTFSDAVVIPHGIYDLKRNEGYITLGTSKDTSEFCCDCIRDWWENYGKENYPNANSILILADGGGSNSSRHYIFKEDLQRLVDEIGIEIRITHYPPYTSKYNPIEHRLFCHITNACKGAVFSSIDVVKSLVDKTHTSKGLRVFSKIKEKVYAKARKVSEKFKENMRIAFDEDLGKWNYTAIPLVKT